MSAEVSASLVLKLTIAFPLAEAVALTVTSSFTTILSVNSPSPKKMIFSPLPEE
jgi:hypothetical protein